MSTRIPLGNGHLSRKNLEQVVSGSIQLADKRKFFRHWKNCRVCTGHLSELMSNFMPFEGITTPGAFTIVSIDKPISFHFCCSRNSVIAAAFNKTTLVNKIMAAFAFPIKNEPTPFSKNVTQLTHAYFRGRPLPRIPLSPHFIKTDFSRRVLLWTHLIPFGETANYGMVARWLRRPGTSRAVGGALHRNPLPVFIPCHRIVGRDGSLTGFGGGINRKKFLLELEQKGCHQNQLVF